MTFSPVDPIESFAEALSVPPILHVHPTRELKVLVLGQFALPVVKLALRYPNTAEAHLVAVDNYPKDRRVISHRSLDHLPKDLKVALVGVAVPGDPSAALLAIKPYTTPDAVVVVAVDQLGKGRKIKDTMQTLWRQVLPYREHAPDPALFLMASDQKFGAALRPFPPGLKRQNPRYLGAMFTLAKDEYDLLYGPGAA
jgi:hypothetical protein